MEGETEMVTMGPGAHPASLASPQRLKMYKNPMVSKRAPSVIALFAGIGDVTSTQSILDSSTEKSAERRIPSFKALAAAPALVLCGFCSTLCYLPLEQEFGEISDALVLMRFKDHFHRGSSLCFSSFSLP